MLIPLQVFRSQQTLLPESGGKRAVAAGVIFHASTLVCAHTHTDGGSPGQARFPFGLCLVLCGAGSCLPAPRSLLCVSACQDKKVKADAAN